MNKLEMAHDYLKVLLTQNTSRTVGEAVETAYALADAMQAEADKCEKAEEEKRVTESRKFFESMTGEMKDHVHDYIYGRICACGKVEDVEEEWQPDWDLASSDATTWKTVNNVAIWLSSNGQPLCTAPTFGITGCLVVERPQ